MDMREKTISSKILFDGKIIRLRYDVVELPDGKQSTREIIEHPGGVAVVAIDHENYVYMVRQYRRPLDDLLLEIPAGKLDYGEDHRACGIRELEEETGMKSKNFEYLGGFHTTPGFSSEVLHLYLATDLYEGTMNTDADEFLQVEKYKLENLMKMILNNEIKDGKTIIGILKAQLHLNKGK